MELQSLFEEVGVEEVYFEEPAEEVCVAPQTVSLADDETPDFLKAA